MNLDYINLGIALTALFSSFVLHLRRSRCCHDFIDIQMKDRKNSSSAETPNETPNETPIEEKNETSLLIHPSSPIIIPHRISVKKNYI